MISPANSGRPEGKPGSRARSPSGAISSSNMCKPARRQRATRRGISQATIARAAPTAKCNSATAPIVSAGADVEAEIAQDSVADDGRREIAEAHAEDQRPGKIDAGMAAVDAALDPPGGALAAGEALGRPVPALRHRR